MPNTEAPEGAERETDEQATARIIREVQHVGLVITIFEPISSYATLRVLLQDLEAKIAAMRERPQLGFSDEAIETYHSAESNLEEEGLILLHRRGRAYIVTSSEADQFKTLLSAAEWANRIFGSFVNEERKLEFREQPPANSPEALVRTMATEAHKAYDAAIGYVIARLCRHFGEVDNVYNPATTPAA